MPRESIALQFDWFLFNEHNYTELHCTGPKKTEKKRTERNRREQTAFDQSAFDFPVFFFAAISEELKEEEGAEDEAEEEWDRERVMDLDIVIKAMPPAAHNDSNSGVHILFRPT